MRNENDRLRKLLTKIGNDHDAGSFKLLFDLTYSKLIRFATFYLKNEAYAQDVVANVYIKIWENRDNFQQVTQVYAYLYTITKRLSLNFLRDNEISLRTTHDYSDVKITSTDPEDILLNAELMATINHSIKELPPKCLMVFQMVKEDGLKYREVAEILNISEKAVEKHIGKALKKVRADVMEYLSGSDKNLNFSFQSIISLLLTAFFYYFKIFFS